MLRIIKVDVKIKPSFLARFSYEVTPVWEGVDRSSSISYICPSQELADRLVVGIKENAVITDPEIKEDDSGKTFVSYKMNVSMRNLEQDLTALGY